jgi:hypothetical protein
MLHIAEHVAAPQQLAAKPATWPSASAPRALTVTEGVYSQFQSWAQLKEAEIRARPWFGLVIDRASRY